MLKLFVGDATQDLSDYANKHAQSTLITNNNYKKIIQLSKTQDLVMFSNGAVVATRKGLRGYG